MGTRVRLFPDTVAGGCRASGLAEDHATTRPLVGAMDTAPLSPRSGTSQTVSGLRAARAVLPLAASSDHNTLGGHTGRQDPRKHSSL